jgi:hypothetical protein
VLLLASVSGRAKVGMKKLLRIDEEIASRSGGQWREMRSQSEEEYRSLRFILQVPEKECGDAAAVFLGIDLAGLGVAHV